MMVTLLKVSILILVASQYVETQRYTEKQCVTVCRNTVRFRHRWMRRMCNECVQNPPMGYLMCSVAGSHPNNEYLQKIADECVSRVPLTDKMCITACRNHTLPSFNKICRKCIQTPPITGTMCIYACDNSGNRLFSFNTVCYKCSINPPASSRLCRHACQITRNNYYRGICSSRTCRNYVVPE